jgi:RNA polymerase sigma-70 factor (ECF subfamily)
LILLKEKKPIRDKAFEVIWNRYSQKLLQYCQANSKSKEDAYDLFQNTWLRFNEVALKEKKIQSINLYLFKIAYNLKLKKLESEKLDIVYIDSFRFDDFINENLNFLDEIEYREFLLKFNEALSTLDIESKECLSLHLIGELSFIEISNLLNENYDCIRFRCLRAIQKIMPFLELDFKNNN